ncbi:hypothetical protein RclHR1_05990012 [Rhizophagus clarus]|uniref:Tc1-like transposase DDE domain-containing protein n=1 Tax=Rhizophagus clarus TaxID=94130 RepID=A0A2Z6RVV3_9GLOM|nr:hypothetical protein RclHR1_05990012 [Rhizophagus clarus]
MNNPLRHISFGTFRKNETTYPKNSWCNCLRSHSSRTIAKQLGCGKTTINDILKRLRETHSLTPKKQTGHPPLLDSPAQQKLKSFIKEKENNENRRLCSKKIATTWTAQTKQPISCNTIRRNLKKVGLTACIPRRKPAMTEAHFINDFVVPTLHTHFPRGNGIFQEDNAAPHRSKVATAARENAGIVTLDWPAQSPDINPIENIWAEMKMMIRCHSPHHLVLVCLWSMLQVRGMTFLLNIIEN